jgi:hypothetical protein
MPQCPTCNADLKEDYGMVACSACEAIVFIDMDGRAWAAGSEPGAEAPDSASLSSGDLPAFFETNADHTTDTANANAESAQPGEPPKWTPHDAPVWNTPGESVPDFGPAEDPLRIASYANSELSQARDGMIVYTILISGIDTKEIRESIREALEDSRFAWNSGEIMGTLNKGVLKIENISPVKSVILVNRIKRLPLKIRWEQNAITQIGET